jgi:serine palmitoyltransferase
VFLFVAAGPGTLVLSDALNHTSIVAGVKASGAVVKVFRHNDMAHLEKLLRWHIAEGQPRTHRPWRKVRSWQ